jgi:hypothetical protein
MIRTNGFQNDGSEPHESDLVEGYHVTKSWSKVGKSIVGGQDNL